MLKKKKKPTPNKRVVPESGATASTAVANSDQTQ